MRPDRGFTLLETLLALAIGGLVLAAAYAAVVRAAAARDGATQRTAGVAAARRALLEVTQGLETAAPRPFWADASELRVAHGDPAPRLVRWTLEGAQLVERHAPAFGTADAGEGPPRVLLDGVQAFTVRCFDGGAWVTGWRAEAPPRAVELALRMAGGEELRTRVVLPLADGG
jgi:prepilin-type N-terminal cleavage/methylation domain-containing protein